MVVTNQVLNVPIKITAHARQRFAERCSGDIAKRLAASVPFGASVGDAMSLKDGDAIFRIRGKDCVTVLKDNQYDGTLKRNF